MNIGIDFDNTIAKYDSLFQKVAQTNKFVLKNLHGYGKNELRDYLRSQPDGEKAWMKLQGLVYGKYMLGAEMMPGVANFFLSCKAQNYRIVIVSHKTKYGHFDAEKILLRREALKWMKTKHFFDPDYFGINKNDVFFADTREEKVKKIGSLKCDWFIDDLPEVFEEKIFPSDTKRILFGHYNPELFHNITILNSWRKISEKIIGEITYKDIVAWSKQVAVAPVKKIEKIPGRGNSNVYKVIDSDGKCYALKYYPDNILDKRTRLKTEFSALRLLNQHNIINIPKAIVKNDDLNLGLYEWINGANITKPSVNDLDQAIDFIGQLYTLSQKIEGKDIDRASEACLSINGLVSQIEMRLLRLKQEAKYFQELSKFLKYVFEPLWTDLKEESISIWPPESMDRCLPQKKQILSPSDFGFHNCLKLENGMLSFLDFDYFGWDDPVKLTADFIWHPAMNLNSELKTKWREAMLKLFSHDHQFESRLNATIHFYGMRWAMIVLNEFLPEFGKQRKEASGMKNYNFKKSQKIQLNKAKHYCEIVRDAGLKVTYA